MPIYDVKCRECGYEGTETLKIADLFVWDKNCLCPHCGLGSAQFGRFIKKAPSGGTQLGMHLGARGTVEKKRITSAQRDDMRHREFQKRDKDQVAAAVEIVKKGGYEGF